MTKLRAICSNTLQKKKPLCDEIMTHGCSGCIFGLSSKPMSIMLRGAASYPGGAASCPVGQHHAQGCSIMPGGQHHAQGCSIMPGGQHHVQGGSIMPGGQYHAREVSIMPKRCKMARGEQHARGSNMLRGSSMLGVATCSEGEWHAQGEQNARGSSMSMGQGST